MKRLDGGPALLFTNVRGHAIPVVGNFLAAQDNCEAAFGVDYVTIREFIVRALAGPLSRAERRRAGPGAAHTITSGIDIGATCCRCCNTRRADSGRFITAGVVVTRDPETRSTTRPIIACNSSAPTRPRSSSTSDGICGWPGSGRRARGEALADRRLHRNRHRAAIHRRDDGLADAGEHGRAGRRRRPRGPAAAGDRRGHAAADRAGRERDRARGRILPDRRFPRGRSANSSAISRRPGEAPLVEITAVTHRTAPIYHAINGYGRETVMLRKYVLEASLLKVLTAPFRSWSTPR